MIRYAQFEDISRIAEIIVFGKRVAYRPIFQDDFGSFHQLQVGNLIQEYQENPALINNFLLYDDGIVKGVINGKDYQDNNRDDEIEVCDFYVEPFFKGQGIGKRLLEYFCKEVARKGKKKVYLWVIEENETARRFYERNGFYRNYQTKPVEGTPIIDVGYEKILYNGGGKSVNVQSAITH